MLLFVLCRCCGSFKKKTKKQIEGLWKPYLEQGFPGGSEGKEYACNAGDPGSIPD